MYLNVHQYCIIFLLDYNNNIPAEWLKETDNGNYWINNYNCGHYITDELLNELFPLYLLHQHTCYNGESNWWSFNHRY